ncbi:hypothetical protein L9G15_18160 [Shewanella sp. A3A]|nr:hypothetical protein [Shewanella ferrihydritica]
MATAIKLKPATSDLPHICPLATPQKTYKEAITDTARISQAQLGTKPQGVAHQATP